MSRPERREARGAHTGRDEHLLHPRLGTFESGRGRGRPEGEPAGARERVHNSRDEWFFGPDHHQIRVELGGEIDDRRRIGERDRSALRDARHTGVARRADHLVDERRARQSPRERMLAPAGTDDEDSGAHAARGSTIV